VLYTGTGAEYLRDSIRAFGEFRHATQPFVYLDENPFAPMGYALQRSNQYGDSPVVLVVDTDKLDQELFYDGTYRTEALNLGSFLPYELPVGPDGRVSEEASLGVYRVADLVLRKSCEEICREVSRSSETLP